MKTITTTLLVMLAIFAKSQCSITVSPNQTACADDHVTISAIGATSYTWVVGSGSATQYNTTGVYSSSYPWSTYVTVKGQVGACVATATVLITVDACTGIGENTMDSNTPVYYDMMGNRVDKSNGAILIERIGHKSKKIVIQQP